MGYDQAFDYMDLGALFGRNYLGIWASHGVATNRTAVALIE